MAGVLAWAPDISLGETTVRFEVAMPAEKGELIWGLTRGGIELARGRQPAQSTAASQTLAFDIPTADLPAEADPPVIAQLCINRDQWDSYTASFGDYFASAAVRQASGRWVASVSQADWKLRKPASPSALLTVHYHRYEGDYQNVSLWTWDQHLKRAPSDNELAPVGRDRFGVVFQLDASLYGAPGDQVGLLPRLGRDWGMKDGPDRFWSPSMGPEVYLVQSSPDVTTTLPDVSPRLVEAALDGERTITARFSRRVPISDWTTEGFLVTTRKASTHAPKAVRAIDERDGRADAYAIDTHQPVDLREECQVEAKGAGKAVVRLGQVLDNPSRFFSGLPLGVQRTSGTTTFRVFAPTAQAVRVVIADAPAGNDAVTHIDMRTLDGGVWEAVVPRDLEGKYYAYRLSGPGLDPAAEVIDIYATCTQGRHPRSLIVDLPKTDPPGFRGKLGPASEACSPSDIVVYEMHIRDFTFAPDSGAHARGKYLGICEAGTHLAADAGTRTGLNHLVELGVTHVQLLPVQDFDNQESGGGYDWGYMPIHFNSPEGSYASTPDGPAKIRELKTLVHTLHQHGIGVIMDVVYNHTSSQASFDRLVPSYYYRRTAGGKLANGSGCGNEFRSEAPMARRFILDSLRYWVSEYQVDGFRFDLMGLIDGETMQQIHAELAKLRPGIQLYGEPWTSGPTPLKVITGKEQVRGTGIGAFNDGFRDAIKGDRDGGPGGYIQRGDRAERVRKGLEGSINDWAKNPVDVINYFEAHDNLTAWDKLLQSAPKATDEVRERMMRLGALILFTSQGRIFVHAGQDFCRTKQGNSNSYNAPDEINQIDWSLKRRHRGVFDYVRGMIALRKAHPVLRLRTREEVEKRVSFGTGPSDRCLICRLDGDGLPGEPSKQMLVLLNGTGKDTEFSLPAGTWSILADADRAGVDELAKAADRVKVPPHAGALLVR